MDINKLSVAELKKNNIKLVREFFIGEGYDLVKITGQGVQTKYEISKNNEKYTIKLMSYRFNPNARGNYAWTKKQNFQLVEYDYLFFVLYYCSKVYILKIPTEVFVKPKECSAFKNHDYWNKKSAPEYGISIDGNIDELLAYKVAESCNQFSLCNK